MQYYVDWTRPLESVDNEAEKKSESICNNALTLMKSVLASEYSDAPQLLEFCLLIEKTLSLSSENRDDALHMLEALDEMLWAYTLK